MRTVVLPVLVILLVGALMGMGFNAVRPDVSISVGRNYFKIAQAPVGSTGGEEAASATSAPDALESEINNPFAAVSVDEMIEIVNGEEILNGEIVIVDARNDEHFAEGHIPGAFQIDNYNVDRDFGAVLPYLEAAERVIVYCGGGDCEDSIFLATELESRGIEFDKLAVFEGGMKEWVAEELPLEEGAQQLEMQESSSSFEEASDLEPDDQ